MAGSTRIAMRKYQIPQPMTVEYMLSDHLGSTSLTTDVSGVKILELRYRVASRAALWRVDKACPLRYTAGVLREGEVRATWTANPTTTPAYKSPAYTYTGQYSYMDDPATSGIEGFGLMYYGARFYDPSLGRFTQADTIIPEETQGTQAWDRYAGMNNNPVKYNDPTGHFASIVAGVILGAAIGWGVYALASGSQYNARDAWIAAGVGAAGGALIGTGVGIANGSVMIAGITANAGGTFASGALAASVAEGAGAGMLGSQLAYTTVAGEKYNTSDMLVQAGHGAMVGAVTGYTGAASRPMLGLMSKEAAVMTNIATNTIMGASQYSTTQVIHGRAPDPGKMLVSGVWGGAVSGVSEIIAPVKASRYWIEAFGESFIRSTGFTILYNITTSKMEPDPCMVDEFCD